MTIEGSKKWLANRINPGLLIRHIVADETGSSLVEIALSLTLLLICIFGIADCSRMLYIDHFLAGAGREAARYAMVRGSSWSGAACASVTSVSCTASSAGIQSYVNSITPGGIKTALLTVTTTWPGTTASGASCTATGPSNGPGCVVAVKLNYQFNFVTPLLPKGSVVLTSTSKLTIAY